MTIRIGTYNIWDANAHWPERLQAICEEITRIGADVLALQEVRDRVLPGETERLIDVLARQAHFEHSWWESPPDEKGTRGLAFLSRHPIDARMTSWSSRAPSRADCAVRIAIHPNGASTFGITNVHLSWRSIADAERQAVGVVEWLAADKTDGYEIMLGDFNCVPGSSVHRFLTGKQSLYDRGTSWCDAAESFARRRGSAPAVTLDTVGNPRWVEYERDYIGIPARLDWILIRDDWHSRNTLRIDDVVRFGDRPTPATGLVPSDHYGLYVDCTPVPATISYEEIAKEWY